jgi:RNA polymerase sigma factor (sigma-70 family)
MTHIWRRYRFDDGTRGARIIKVEPAWPGPLPRRESEAHNAQTRALIAQWKALDKLDHSGKVVPLLERWQWLDQMSGPAEKQRFLEPHLEAVRRDPVAHEAELLFLVLVCEPMRRSVAAQLCAVRLGLEPRSKAAWHRREEARRLEQIERERLFLITQDAVLEALYRYPVPPPDRFFPWMRETIAHRALDFVRSELPEVETTPATAEEAEAMQAHLHGFEGAEEPVMRDRAGLRGWRLLVNASSVFAGAAEYFEFQQVRLVCRDAIGRLPHRQREVIDEYFFAEREVPAIAERRRVSESTAYNLKTQAQHKLHDDDCFFAALHGLRLVRDEARLRRIHRLYPDGRLPDGRRIVAIEETSRAA